MARNGVVTIDGIVKGFSARRAVKEGDQKTLIGKICVLEPEQERIAELCPKPKDAVKAMRAARTAKASVELPCRQEEMTAAYKVGKKTRAANNHVTLKKLVVDYRNGKEVAEIHYGEPLLIEVATFYLDRLGADIVMAIEPMQKELDLDDGE